MYRVLLYIYKGVNDSEVTIYTLVFSPLKKFQNSYKSRGLNILLSSLQHLNDIDLSFILCSNIFFHKISKALP